MVKIQLNDEEHLFKAGDPGNVGMYIVISGFIELYAVEERSECIVCCAWHNLVFSRIQNVQAIPYMRWSLAATFAFTVSSGLVSDCPIVLLWGSNYFVQ